MAAPLICVVSIKFKSDPSVLIGLPMVFLHLYVWGEISLPWAISKTLCEMLS